MTKKFLDTMYAGRDPHSTRDVYDNWAATYDAEVSDNGYATPPRLAKLMMDTLKSPDTPILDYGCGTGLSGKALSDAGFQILDGIDPSNEMLDVARKTGLYRDLTLMSLEDPNPVPQGQYQIIAAIGVIGTGAAPASTFDLLMEALPTGGHLCFSYNDHALAEKPYTDVLDKWLTSDAKELAREYGPHLPARNMNSNVYIIEKT